MINHYIIMSSSYSKGTRIALHRILDKSNYKALDSIVKNIIAKCGDDVSISTHFIQTDSESFESVSEKDYFFNDVEVIESEDEFIQLIQKDRVLKGTDVAKYILSKVSCTHLKLEKLVYFCFAEYLYNYDKDLYEDTIYAYKYGPVVKSVYEKYTTYGYKEIEKDVKDIDATNVDELPSKSRILFSESGIQKIKSIDETIEKYGNLSASMLVELTHRPDTPWAMTSQGGCIENDIIKAAHYNECL